VAARTIVAVLGTRYPDLSVEEAILAPRGVRLMPGPGRDSDDIVAVAGEAAVVLVGGAVRLDAAVIERLSCIGIVRYGVGVETVDLAAASRSGMWVAYVPDYGTEAVATHTVALILGALRRITLADRTVKSGRWGLEELRPLSLPSSLTVGVVGAGRIGRRVAELLAPFGFDLVMHDAYVDIDSAAPGVKSASLKELLEISDVVTLHVPGSPSDPPLLGASELDRLRPGAILVNTARGSLVDAAALLDRLRSGAIALAALDVFETEPPGPGFSEVFDRTILTPHMAWYTEETEVDLRTKAAGEALRLLDGLPPLNAAAVPDGDG
jgi:D-3-phosphoglycerate dehydrogenase / 2-oxoglutarate reductase